MMNAANHWKHAKPPRRDPRAAFGLGLLLLSTSCVPTAAADQGPRLAFAALPADLALAAADPAPRAPDPAAAALNAAIPVSGLANPPARGFHLASASFGDRAQALECLAKAVYYEARSQSEEGQRAVAQVVLNRVRHPSYPSSVCGVVYQGPMRPGGGCQFTFTCDGSLARAPEGIAWGRARAIAGAALAGSVYAPIGMSTHYHADYVFPHWAPSFVKAAVIGEHIFYRWGGGAGAPAAFSQVYSGRESLPVSATTPVQPPRIQMAAAAPTLPPPGAPITDNLPQAKQTSVGLPESRVREEYRNSGQPLADPAR